jgi:hypothetical protein
MVAINHTKKRYITYLSLLITNKVAFERLNRCSKMKLPAVTKH